MKRLAAAALCLAVFTLYLSPLANAAEYSLGEIVVSKDAPAESDTVSTLSEVTAEDIKSSGAKTLDEAISLLPGVYVRVGGDGTPRIDIRGMRTRNVTLMLDGVPFNSTYDNQFDPTLIPVENIARIKVVRGAASVLYGPGGNAGAINIITKKGDQDASGMLGVQFGDNNELLTRGSVGGTVDKVSMFGSFRTYDTNGFSLADNFDTTADEDGGLRENSDRNQASGYANLSWAPSDDTEFGFSVMSYRGSHEVPYIIYNSRLYSNQKYTASTVDDAWSLQASASHDFDGPFELRGWLYYNTQDEEENRYDDETLTNQVRRNAYRQQFTTTIAGATVQPAFDFKDNGKLTTSFAYANQAWDGTLDEVLANFTPFVRTLDEARTVHVYSADAEYEIRPLESLGLVAGFGLQNQEKEDATAEGQYSYFLGADLQVLENTQLHVNHARKIRFASLKELYDGDDGNDELGAEATYHYEFGLEQAIPTANMSISASAFLINAENFIEKDGVTNIYENHDKYRMTGVETFVDFQPLEALNMRASYTYTEATNEGEDRTYDRLQNRPRHMAALESTYNTSFGTTMYLGYSYAGDQVGYNRANTPQLVRVAQMHVVDAKVSQALSLTDTQELEFYIGVDNILDYDYEYSAGLPAPGRAIYTGLEYHF